MKVSLWVWGVVFLIATCHVNAVEKCAGYVSPGNTYGECTSNPKGEGNCVWWAAHKRPDLNFPHIRGIPRNAANWMWYAQQYRFPTGNVPEVGAVAVLGMGSVGHVAYVESVNNDGSFVVTEQDYYGSFGTGTVIATYHPTEGGYKRHNGKYLGKTVIPLLGSSTRRSH